MKRENNDFSHLAAAHVVSSDDLAAAGKALRQEVLRKEHGWWKPAEDRANLIDTLRKLDEGRMKEQLPTPLRTDASISFRLLSWCSLGDGTTPTTGLKVQTCGDCRLIYFGAFRDARTSYHF